MIRWRLFQNEKYLVISLFLSVTLHIILFLLFLFPGSFFSAKQDVLQQQSTGKALIRLHSLEEEEDNLNQFVSVVKKKSVGKLTKSPSGIHVPGEGKQSITPGVSSITSSALVSRVSSIDLLEKIKKKSPGYTSSIVDPPVNQINHVDNSVNESLNTINSQEGGKVFSQDSRDYQFSTFEQGLPQIGSAQHEWAEFYLSYSESCSTSLKNLFRLVPLVGTDQIIFVTNVFKDGTIKFVKYLQQSPKYPVLDDIGKQMINFSKRLDKVSLSNFSSQKNFIQVIVKLAYSQHNGIWTISFYGDHD